jgi:hypothetical protein
MSDVINPFDIVKATDLTDGQIEQYFVDFAAGASLLERIKPRSPMPMFIFGGKGSGKTHLMRYLSYPLQVQLAGNRAKLRAALAEGYLGLYFKSSGLNAQRFAGKKQSSELWQAVFAYYMEIWVAQLVLATISDLYSDDVEWPAADIVSEAVKLLDVPPTKEVATLADLIRHLQSMQREADIAINNTAITGRLKLRIQATPGRLVFGLPQLLAKHLPDLSSTLFVYLVDELENLTAEQQKYVNTLIRERQAPCTFKIGVRLYGMRTAETLNAREENRENAEYEALRLDEELRTRPESDKFKFATDLVRRRLVESGYFPSESVDAIDLQGWFEAAQTDDPLMRRDFGAIADKYRGRLTPYVSSLRDKLTHGYEARVAPGVRGPADIDSIVAAIRYPESPFVERANTMLLYRAWAQRKDLPSTAAEIRASALNYAEGKRETQHHALFKHWKTDVIAQLLRDTKHKQRYVGFSTFVDMSAGLPRCLLTILKYVFTWSLFNGEQPFRQGVISVGAQTEGVAQASEWFFNEARAPGIVGTQVRDAMTRLGQLLRDIRYSDKPSECSLCTFSVDVTTTRADAVAVLRAADDWSMLIRIRGGQPDRNMGRVDDKYQVHPMLAPRWGLPISRRGSLAFSGEEASAVFAPADPSEFDSVVKRRVDAMDAPYFGRPHRNDRYLPGFIDG